MIPSKLVLVILSLILIVLAILPYIKGDQRWYLQSDLSGEESKTQSEILSPQTSEVIERSDNENNSTELDSLGQLTNQNESLESLPKQLYSGRSSKALDFDDLFDEKGERSSFEGDREARIINDKDSKLAIKGFIPIVGFGNDKHDSEEKPKKQELADIQNYMSQLYPQGLQNGYSHSPLNPPQHISRPEDQRFIGAALQGFAASLAGKPTRKQGFGYEPSNLGPNDGCICVPFYLCKNGYLSESAKSSALKSPNIESAQSIINQFSIPMPNSRPQYQQKHHSSNQYDYLPLDERSNDDLKISGSHDSYSQPINNSAPQYADEVLARMLGVRSDGCGVLRTCCRPPIPEAEFPLAGLPEYQIPGNYPNGLIPIQDHSEFNKRLTNPYQPPIQQIHDYIKPQQRPHKYESPYQRPVEAYPTQIVQASYGFPTKHSNPAHNYGQIPPRPVISQIPIPVKPEYPPIKPIHQRPVPVYPNYKPHPSSHSIDGIGSHGSYGTCGVRQAVGIHGRVQNLNYHESSTEFGEFPWQVAILKRLGPADSLYVCGGALISPLFIVTAAHCIKKYQSQDLKIRLGEWDVHREDEFYPYIEKYIQEIIVHPEFFPGSLLNDIALIRMESPVDLNQYPHIAPVCLPEPHENFAGHRCFVSGWGKNSFGHQGEFQSVLTKVDVPVLNHGECEHALKKTRLGYNYHLHPSMVCAGGELGKDACEGDGGSGLVCDIRGIWKAVGLVSWGVGCGKPGIPGVYTNLAYLKPWIDSIVLRFSAGSIGSVGNIDTIYGVISERSFPKTDNSTENQYREDRQESEDSSTTTTMSSV